MIRNADIRIPTEWLLILAAEIKEKNIDHLVFYSESGNVLEATRIKIRSPETGKMVDSWDFLYNPDD